VNDSSKTVSDWLKQIPLSTFQLDTVPLLGAGSSFPWTEFSEKFCRRLSLDTISFSLSNVEWREERNLLQGLAHPALLHFTIPSLEGAGSIACSEEDLKFLMSLALTHKSDPLDLTDPEFLDGFYHFLVLEAINTIGQVDFDTIGTIQLSEQEPQHHSAALCLDIDIHFPYRKSQCRIILSSDLRKAWAKHFTLNSTSALIASHQAQDITVTLSLQAGKSQLSLTEWRSTSPGDFILLNTSYFDPQEKSGRLLLTLNEHPLFGVKIKDGSLKLSELVFSQVGETPMERTPDEEDFEELGEFDEDLDLEDDEIHDELTEDEEPEADTEDEEQTEESVPSKEPKKEGLKANKSAQEIIDTQDLPLNISIEVGRIQIPIKKLMELEAGNLIEMEGVSPESVDLVINGKCVARGELLKIGEALGVRITEKN